MKNIDKKILFLGIGLLIILIISLIILWPKNNIGKTTKLDGLVIKNGEITYHNNISILTADVTNKNDVEKKDIRLEIKFYDKKNKEITTITGYLGDLEVNQSRQLKASVTDDLSQAKKVKYKIVE